MGRFCEDTISIPGKFVDHCYFELGTTKKGIQIEYTCPAGTRCRPYIPPSISEHQQTVLCENPADRTLVHLRLPERLQLVIEQSAAVQDVAPVASPSGTHEPALSVCPESLVCTTAPDPQLPVPVPQQPSSSRVRNRCQLRIEVERPLQRASVFAQIEQPDTTSSSHHHVVQPANHDLSVTYHKGTAGQQKCGDRDKGKKPIEDDQPGTAVEMCRASTSNAVCTPEADIDDFDVGDYLNLEWEYPESSPEEPPPTDSDVWEPELASYLTLFLADLGPSPQPKPPGKGD